MTENVRHMTEERRMTIARRIRESTPREAEFLFACALLACGLFSLVAGATLILLWDWVT